MEFKFITLIFIMLIDEAMSVIDIMRHQMQTIWTQGFLDSAIILAEYIVTLDNCNSKDTISLAKVQSLSF